LWAQPGRPTTHAVKRCRSVRRLEEPHQGGPRRARRSAH
jgi:hypothetical protein